MFLFFSDGKLQQGKMATQLKKKKKKMFLLYCFSLSKLFYFVMDPYFVCRVSGWTNKRGVKPGPLRNKNIFWALVV